jgi:hypothetical protein
MSKKGDQIAARLKEWMQLSKHPGLWNGLRMVETRGEGSETAAEVRMAFARLGLDPESSADRGILLYVLSEILFHIPAKLPFTGPQLGRPKKWDDKRILQLRRDIVREFPDDFASADAATTDVTIIAKKLKTDYKARYQDTKLEPLKRAIRRKAFGNVLEKRGRN